MKTRTRVEIACDILFFVGGEKNGARPTHILYKANLSPKLLQKYMRMLSADRLVKRVKTADGVRYKLTKGGTEFLGKAKELDGMCNFIELTPANRKRR
jgi:predicted transcriptional regulator